MCLCWSKVKEKLFPCHFDAVNSRRSERARENHLNSFYFHAHIIFRWKETLRPFSRSIVKSTPTHTHIQLPCRWGISFEWNCFHFFYVFIIKINFIAQLVGLLLQKMLMLLRVCEDLLDFLYLCVIWHLPWSWK